MNRAELVKYIAADCEIPQSAAERVLRSFTDAVSKSLKKGNSVALVGFGTFSIRKRAARQGRNPRTGATIKIKAAKLPVFKAGKALKDAVG